MKILVGLVFNQGKKSWNKVDDMFPSSTGNWDNELTRKPFPFKTNNTEAQRDEMASPCCTQPQPRAEQTLKNCFSNFLPRYLITLFKSLQYLEQQWQRRKENWAYEGMGDWWCELVLFKYSSIWKSYLQLDAFVDFIKLYHYIASQM